MYSPASQKTVSMLMKIKTILVFTGKPRWWNKYVAAERLPVPCSARQTGSSANSKADALQLQPWRGVYRRGARVAILNLLLAVFTVAFFLTGCQPQKPEEIQEEEIIPVKTTKAGLMTLEEAVNYVGALKAQNEAVVYPKVSGKIIEKVKEEGGIVKKGEAIAYVDRDEVGLKFEPSPVESPLSGVVGNVYVDLGESVTAGTPVALVVDMEKVKVNLEISEKYLSRINLGQEAKITVDAYPGEEFKGEISKISPVLVSATHAAPLEISVPNPEHRLKSGMFARIELILQKHEDAVTVLKEALMGRTPDCYVYVIEDGKAVSKKVVLGISQGQYCEIKSGLSGGEKVVVVGQQRLYDGAKAAVEE